MIVQRSPHHLKHSVPELGLIILVCVTTLTCARSLPPEQETLVKLEKDVHSFANTDDVVVDHLDLDLAVDFEKREIAGKAGLRISNKSGARVLRLDTDKLTIQRVSIEPGGNETGFSLGESKEHLGRPLDIEIMPETQQVNVYYLTSPDAPALQWLEPPQTAGGQKPFLLTQSEPILARSWIPCQDSPGVRMTYRARVKTRPDLLALMSAENPTAKSGDGVYEFEMPQRVPSYLLALAVGDIDFRTTGKRSGVYAEPSVLDRAAWELAETEQMIETAESLYGPYRWDRYDVIVLPPSFPLGGMENPRLTFATPTILAGDRSLVSLIAHELAHSWSGNLVTNATWNDFWLNEGFTVYIERRIMEAVSGRDYSEMLAQLGYQDLIDTMTALGAQSPRTQLHLDLTNQDPDLATNDIAYEKGYFLLRLIEETVGRSKWDGFLRSYFDTFAFRNSTSEVFLGHLRRNLIKDNGDLEATLRLDEWINRPGLPDNCPKVSAKAFQQVEEQATAWASGKPATELRTENWTTHHWLHFLRSLPKSLSETRMGDLDRAFGFTNSGNAEILSAWLLQAITNRYRAAYPAIDRFLTSVGRRKFLKPLYAKLAETPEGLDMARRIYKKARPGYHSVSYNTIDEILKWQESTSAQ